MDIEIRKLEKRYGDFTALRDDRPRASPRAN